MIVNVQASQVSLVSLVILVILVILVLVASQHPVLIASIQVLAEWQAGMTKDAL